jgi:hypothetical protein
MAKNGVKINPDHTYAAQEAALLLELTVETIKKKCRDGEIKGIQKGSKKKWHVKGSEILRLRKIWNLD